MVKGRVILSTWIESLPVNGLYLSSMANESMSVCHLPHWVPFEYRRECIFFKDLSGKVISYSYLASILISLIKSSRHGGALPMIKQNQNLFIRSFSYCYLLYYDTFFINFMSPSHFSIRSHIVFWLS